jgi:alpha-galactosidase
MGRELVSKTGAAAMRRRSFLASAAAAASLAAVRAARSSEPRSEPMKSAWVLFHGTSRYVVRLDGPAIAVDCDGRAGLPGLPDATIAPDRPATEAPMLVAGPQEQPVLWRVGTWYQPDPLTLRIALSAEDLPLTADVEFVIDAATGMLLRRTTVRHSGIGSAVEVAATLAFWFGIHEPVDEMRYLAGDWAQEMQIRRGHPERQLHIESRKGKTGFEFQPYVALLTGTSTYLCQIFWSGNWTLDAVPHPGGAAVFGGYNNWRFRCRLSPLASRLPLPTVLFGRFDGDLNAATQRLHDYRRAHRPDPDRAVPVQFNSWYPYLGEPNAEAMLALIPFARAIGCEVFVVDAGWFKTDGGESDADWEARTGDWRTSRRRFPNGLREISARCREQGLRFGLWFEPEVIGSLSAIRRDHPEWLHHPDGQAPAAHERAVLNLGVPAARRHAFERITRILSSVGVDWMKWDFNADLGAGGWAPGLPAVLTDQDPLIAHYEGLYRLQNAVRRWFPDLILEMCASGGGRIDGELLSHAHLNWLSDQPGPLRKLAIHIGSQLAHPAVVCNGWLIEWPPGSIAGYDDQDAAGVDERGDLPFRLRIAMLGSFGISARIDLWPEADRDVATAHIALYREKLRPLIHHGDQYLLTEAPPPDGNGDWAAIWYAAKDGLSGVLFVFRLRAAEASRAFLLPGLAPDRSYRGHFYSGSVVPLVRTGQMVAIKVTLPTTFQSELCCIEAY